ncbi:MAG: basic secretory protein-like protein [Zavarzinella sp.]
MRYSLICLVGCIASSICLAQPKTVEVPSKALGKPVSLIIEGEISEKIAPTVGNFVQVYYEAFPKLLKNFENPDRPAEHAVKLIFKRDMRVPAYCTGGTISISIEWIEKNPNDLGLLVHELTHVVQSYPRGAPGWLVEGIADYSRYKFSDEKNSGWKLPPLLGERNKYTDSYRVTARFLVWLDARHPGVVEKIHFNLQKREYKQEDFKTLTGRDLEVLWEECVRDLAKSNPKSK